MLLKEQYTKYQEIYNKGYAFDPDNHEFFYDPATLESPGGKKREFQKPEGFEDWDAREFDFRQYYEKRLEELGITEKINSMELLEDVGDRTPVRREQPLILCSPLGHIEILQYGLDRRIYNYMPKGKTKANHERECVQTRLHPWAEKLCEGKYDRHEGVTAPYWPKALIEAYENKTPVDTLVLTEGQIKAFKGAMHDIMVAGLTSINHYKDQHTKTIHSEIIHFLRDCKVKKLVVLWDGDCRNISSKALDAGMDISERPGGFFAYAKKIRELIYDFIPPKKLEIFFATIRSADLDDEPKGLDDLLVAFPNHAPAVRRELMEIGNAPGHYIESINITHDSGIKKMRQYFLLDSVQAFYGYHKERIRGNSFVWNGNTYAIKEGLPTIEIRAELRNYKRIGTNYYKVQTQPVPVGKGGKVVWEEVLEGWTKQAIIDDHGEKVIKHIERYDGFTNIANHIEYQQVVGNHWNLYMDIKHDAVPGPWPHIEKLLRHLFQEQYTMILDYLTVLYRDPAQKLPVVCLLSKEQGTGKSTFIYLQKLIFKQNMVLISNSDLSGDFNSHWTSKLIAGCEETLLEKKDGYEKLKNYVTAKTIMRNEKNKAATEHPCMLHFTLCSNNEDDFIRINEHDRRLWIRKVHPIGEKIKNFDQKLEAEVAHFVHELQQREIVYQDPDESLFFDRKDIRTDAFYHVVKHSEPSVIKEIREKLEDSFLKWGGSERLLAVKDLKEHFRISGEDNYLNKVISSVLRVERKKDSRGHDTVTTYSFLIDDPADPTKSAIRSGKGRPFVFPAHLFVKYEDLPVQAVQQELSLATAQGNDPPLETPEDDLPF